MFQEPEFDKICREADEINFYFVCNDLSAFSWRMTHDMNTGRIPREDWAGVLRDVEKARTQLRYAAAFAHRFGIKAALNPYGGLTYEFNAWHSWWHNYIEGLSREDWQLLEMAMNAKEDVSAWRPAGDWRSNLSEERDASVNAAYSLEADIKLSQEVDELGLYYLTVRMGEPFIRITRNLNNGTIGAEHREGWAEIMQDSQQLKIVLAATTRFGVETPQEPNGLPTAEVISWYDWWHTYIEGLPLSEWETLKLAMDHNVDISSWRPAGDWKVPATPTTS